jgi:DNA-directed RNA polymerase subunit F
MIGKNVESEELVTLNQVLGELEERKKTRELGYEQQLAYEHAKKFASGLSKDKEEKLRKAIVGLGVSERSAVKIADVMPKNILTLKQILMHENRAFGDDEVAKIMEAIKAAA